MFDQLPVPKDCTDCAATCALKREACAFDMAGVVGGLYEQLAANDIPMDPMPTIEALKVRARECFAEVATAVKAENVELRLAQRVADIMQAKNQRLDSFAAPVKALPPISLPPVEAPPVVEVEAGNGQVMLVEAQAAKSVVDDRQSRGRTDLYVDPEDAALEEDLIAMEGVHGVCTTPKLNIKNLADHVDKYLKPAMADEPFEGLIATIPKMHANNRDLVRVTAYYRGPPPAEVRAVLKERKKELLG